MKVEVRRLNNLDERTLNMLIGIYMRGYEGLREYGGEGEEYAERYIRWCWKKARDGFFVAKVGQDLAGFIVCDAHWYSEYEGRVVGAIHELVIDLPFQGKGVGRALMEAGLEYLRKSTDVVELWVGEKNDKAMRFYESYGFRRVGKVGKWVRMVKHFDKRKRYKQKVRGT